MNQPRAIFPIFFVELWERCGYYSIQGFLLLYLMHHLHFTDVAAIEIVGNFLALAYIAPVFGGLLADSVFGYRYCILIGTISLFIGYILLTFSEQGCLYFGLPFVILGSGLIKPNTVIFLGQFYYKDDPRRYSGLTFYFTMIHIGGLISIFVSSIISNYFTNNVQPFAITAFGIFISIFIFVYYFRYFENRGLHQNLSKLNIFSKFFRKKILFLLIILIFLQIIYILLHDFKLHFIELFIVSILIACFYIYRKHVLKGFSSWIWIAILMSTAILFWSQNFQIFFLILVFTDHFVSHTVFHHTISTSLFVALEPLTLLLLGPLMMRFWNQLSHRGYEPKPLTKFALGIVTTGLSMLLIAGIVYWTPNHVPIDPLWIGISYALLSLSALLIVPTGLGVLTVSVPTSLSGLAIGMWYLTMGAGGWIASVLARRILSNAHHSQSITTYQHAFFFYGVFAFCIGAVLIVMVRFFKNTDNKRWRHKV